MSEEVISEGISLADRMTRLNSAEPVFTDGGHAEGTDGYNKVFIRRRSNLDNSKAELQRDRRKKTHLYFLSFHSIMNSCYG